MSSFTEYTTAGASSRNPLPLNAARDPTSSDVIAPGGEPMLVGRVWVNTVTRAIFLYAGAGIWSDVSAGAGSFASLTVSPGPTSLTGPLTVAANAAGDTITIGSASQTGIITLGQSTAGETVNINNASGAANTVNIANGVSGNTVSLANGVNTSAQTVNIANGASAANSTVNILSGVGTVGVGVLAIGNNTRVTTIGIGNIAPAAARTTTIAGGNSAQSDTVNILAGNPSAGTQTVSILNGTSTGGTQNVNIGNANQAANAVAINSGATNGTSIFAGTTTNIVATQTGTTIQGMANNVAPAAGKIGEQIRSAIAFASAVTSTTTTVTDVTTISLTAGIWDISGIIMFTGMTTATFQQASINTTTATIGTVGDNAIQGVWLSTTAGDFGLAVPVWRLALNATTTVYLTGQGTYSAGTGKLYGRISATRVA